LDLLFEMRVSARKFANTSVDVFEDNQTLEGTAVFDRYEEKEGVAAVRTESIAAERKV
jgi:SP family general alpha glucoside:H+ symporter-like MFS transporter